MKRILIPVDFSEYSEYAMEVAALMAKKFKAELFILHMLGLSEAIFTKNESQEFMEAQYYMKLAKKRFDSFLDKPYIQGLKTFQTVQNYKDFYEINNFVKEKDIDLVVMGSHGTSGLSGLFVGSNTEKVVRTCSVPVLTIKRRRSDFIIKEAVLACNFEVENSSAYNKVIRFFGMIGARVHLVYVNLPNITFKSTEEMKKQVELFMSVSHYGNTFKNEHVVCLNDYSIEEGIYYYAKSIDADLIAIPTHGRQGLAHFFKGSIGEDIANHASLPVLTFRL
ncbi:MAG: universal stress protein [Maribacter sp.]|nr:universal stress protein [Maribacter sp.]